MSRVLVTGSADGLGHAAASTLLGQGHDVVVHVRSPERLEAVSDLVDRGATALVADLAEADQTRDLAEQANALGRMDAVVHNAGVYTGAAILPVNVVAPYLLTALLERPDRLIYLSSGMHRVDPGWVPTKMGGAGATDNLEQGHRTQEWLAVSDDPEARTTGGYWYHRQRQEPEPEVHDEAFQDELLGELERFTGAALPGA